MSARCALPSEIRTLMGRRLRRVFPFLLAGLLLGQPIASFAADSVDSPDALALAPAPFSHTHEWLIYVALGLGGLNTVLLYLLNRSPRRLTDAAAHGGEANSSEGLGGSSSRTDKRMDKRKREIDELRHQLDGLPAESAKHLSPAQIQELVRTFVHDELSRTALPGDSSGH